MKKRMTSLFLALALCLGLLPATALAADNDTVYVGGVELTGTATAPAYATTNTSGDVITEGASADKYNIKWDGSTLTLKDAYITNAAHEDNYLHPVEGAAIGVANSSGAAELTIELESDNTIEDVSLGIWVYSSTTGYASLTIMGNGSLTASVSANSGILVQSNGGNATLSIENAEVTTTSSFSYGVLVQAKDSSNASLTVNGGSLTVTGSGTNFAGIQLQLGSSNYGSGTPSLTVSGNAIVKASGDEGGISDNSNTDIQIGVGDNSSGGIVFDGNKGTVYGSVTLDESLTINQGETLTIPEGSSLTVPEDKTITVESGGKLEGTPIGNGTVKIAPTITTTESLPDGEVGTVYSQTLTATGDPTITWNVTSGSLPDGLNLSGNAISGTPTTAGTSTFTVKAENSYGSDSKQLSITIDAQTNVPVTGVSLDKDSLTLDVGGTATLTATVEPEKATNKHVTWKSNNTNVATVSGGVVAAVGAGTTTITVETEDGKITDTCTVTVNAAAAVPVESVSLNKTELTLTEGNSETLIATVQPANATNQNVTWSSSAESVATVEDGKVTAVGAGETTIRVTTEDGGKTATCAVTVEKPYTPPPYIPPTKTPSQQAIDKIEDARPGDTVKITLRTGQTKLDKEVFEELAGRDVTLEISLPGGVTWTVNGEDIPQTADLTDLDLGVDLGTSGINLDVINTVTGELGSVQITLAHNGAFGFALTLTAPLGKENAGYWANLYHYDEDAETLNYETSAKIDDKGDVTLRMTHASQYAIVIDSKSHQLPFTDVVSDSWYESAVRYAYTHDIMEGMSETAFSPNTSLTRAEAVQVLYNLEGQPEGSGTAAFPDLVYEWYKPAIAWAEQTGVVDGYEDGAFRPDEPVTREEFAQMLYHYAAYKGYDLTAEGDLSQFPDSGSVADWAEAAMSWANGNQLINGHDNGTLEPGGTTTRAQAASILMRFDLNLVKAR